MVTTTMAGNTKRRRGMIGKWLDGGIGEKQKRENKASAKEPQQAADILCRRTPCLSDAHPAALI